MDEPLKIVVDIWLNWVWTPMIFIGLCAPYYWLGKWIYKKTKGNKVNA